MARHTASLAQLSGASTLTSATGVGGEASIGRTATRAEIKAKAAASMRALGHKGQLLYAPEASSQAAGAAAEPVDRATLEAWARGEAAPAKPTPGEAAAEAAEAVAEDARGADLAMEGEVSFEAEEDDRDGEVEPPTSEMESGENQTEVEAAAPL
eukprot:scaffold7914_cov41-Phaeocystis_antarctica.AAC.3